MPALLRREQKPVREQRGGGNTLENVEKVESMKQKEATNLSAVVHTTGATHSFAGQQCKLTNNSLHCKRKSGRTEMEKVQRLERQIRYVYKGLGWMFLSGDRWTGSDG